MRPSDVGRAKVDSAEAAIARLNPHVEGNKIDGSGSMRTMRAQLVAGYDVVVDGSDNFATRYAVSDACFFERRPLVSAAVGEFDGSLTVLKPYERDREGAPNPTYRCLFPEAPPPEGVAPACAEVGVLGALDRRPRRR